MIRTIFKRLNLRLISLLIATCLISACGQSDKGMASIDDFIAASNIDTSKEGWKVSGVPKPPKATFEIGSQYFWLLETNKGKITIELKAQEAPMHVTSTIYLTKLGFYDDILFHRVIPGFMAQGGDPLGEGIGGPGYSYMGEFDSDLSHDKAGILSMANTGSAGTDGSQFFLTFGPTPHLDGLHTVFGEVVEGMSTLHTLEKFGSSPRGTTSEKLWIKKATILVK